MPIEWPCDLPLPTLHGVAQSRQNARQERTGETGPPRFRRKFSAASTGVQMQVVADTSQTWHLEKFYADDLQEGSQPFWMVDPMRDGKPLADETGAILLDLGDIPLLLSAKNLCVFGEPPSISRLAATHNSISFSLWYLP